MNKIIQFLRDYAFARFILPFGLILIVVGCVLFGTVTARQGYPRTEAVVTRLELDEPEYYDGDNFHEATYHTYVRYTVNGQEYEEEYGSFPEIKVGTTVTIDYNPNDPRDISQPVGFWLPTALIAGGIAALIAGAVSIVKTMKKNQKLRKQEEEWQ